MHKDSIGLFAKYSHNFSVLESEAGGDDSAAHLLSIIVGFQNRLVVMALTQKHKVLVYCKLPGTEVKYFQGRAYPSSVLEEVAHSKKKKKVYLTQKSRKIHLSRFNNRALSSFLLIYSTSVLWILSPSQICLSPRIPAPFLTCCRLCQKLHLRGHKRCQQVTTGDKQLWVMCTGHYFPK